MVGSTGRRKRLPINRQPGRAGSRIGTQRAMRRKSKLRQAVRVGGSKNRRVRRRSVNP